MRRASDTTRGAAESYAGVVRQRPSGGVPRKRLRPLATFGGRMHSSDWSRLLTERQREVLTIVVENKVDRNRDSKIPELAVVDGRPADHEAARSGGRTRRAAVRVPPAPARRRPRGAVPRRGDRVRPK